MKHYTAIEIAELITDNKVSGLPASRYRIDQMAKKQDWPGRVRAGQKGGGGIEYPENVLPLPLRQALVRNPAEAVLAEKTPALPALSAKQAEKIHARQALLNHFKRYRFTLDMAAYKAVTAFCCDWRARKIADVPESLYQAIPRLSPRTLERWLKAQKGYDFHILAGQHGQHRLGSGLTGQFSDEIIALSCANQHFTARHIQDALKINNPQDKIPTERSINRFIADWKKKNPALYTEITNPDKAKSQYRPAFGSMYEWVGAPNQLWEIDASPADVLTTEGRYNLYCIIDIYTRRVLVEVSQTAKASAALKLVRRAITEWGLPETIRTDNGADFIAQWFRHTLVQMGVHQDIAPPFCPERKAAVERSFGTIQRDLMPTLKGFIGHSVKDRQAIQARLAFANRLGEKPDQAFCVEMTPDGLQVAVDGWATDIYSNRPHSGIGMTPIEKLAGWPHPLRRVGDDETLNILFAPLADNNGQRMVTKSGIRVEGSTFIAPELGVRVGEQVMVRHDPEDFGRVFIFNSEGSEFICEAENVERLGAERAQVAQEAKSERDEDRQAHKREIKRLGRKLTAGDMNEARQRLYRAENKIHPLPASEGVKPPVTETFPTLFAAEEKVTELPETPGQRFRRALALENKTQITEDEKRWLAVYQTTAEYGARKKLADDYGEEAFA